MSKLNHIAIILDGNRRWAKEQGKKPEYGHKKGAENLEELIKAIKKEKLINVLTVYIFSTENWKRSKVEVAYLMNLFSMYFKKLIKDAKKHNIKVVFSGSDDHLTPSLKKMKYEAMEKTKDNTELVLNLCFNYGGRREILEGIWSIYDDIKEGKIEKKDITEEYISSKMYSPEIPDPELIIRTSGEMRLSNFQTWEGTYSELYFVDKKWPDFKIEDLKEAINEFDRRERRFGGK